MEGDVVAARCESGDQVFGDPFRAVALVAVAAEVVVQLAG